MESSYFVPPQSALNDNNMTININETISCASLKKNLCDEEEFRGINHTEPIHIFLKLKPFTQEDLASNQDQKCYIIHSDTTIKINPPQKSIYFKNQLQNRQLSNRIYTFSFVFQPTITQKDFFNATLLPCFQRFISGDNLLIFSYGVTNSGKTFTMQGNRKNPGLIPRTLDCLFDVIKNNLDSKSFKYKPDKFNEIVTLSNSELQKSINYKEQILKLCANFKDFEQTINELGVQTNTASNGCEISLLDQSKFCFSSESLATIGDNFHVNDRDTVTTINVTSGTKYAIWISFYELYDNSIYDLLVPPSKKDEKRAALRIREDSAHVPYVDGLIQIPVYNTYEAIKILKYGEKNLQKSSNSINLNSSRSHAVFCLKIVTIKNDSTMSVNQLSFCDLAGIERSSKTQSAGKTLKEASTINTSILSLSRCINALVQNQKNKNNPIPIPYRINKLTRLFQAYFEGHGMVKMIININRNANCFDETVGVLNFSLNANKIQLALNEDDKIHYKIETEAVDRSVAWEGEDDTVNDETTCMEEDIEEEDEEEDDDDDDDDENGNTDDDNDDEEENEEDEDEDTQVEEDESNSVLRLSNSIQEDASEIQYTKAKKKIIYDNDVTNATKVINDTKSESNEIGDNSDEEMEQDDDDDDDDGDEEEEDEENESEDEEETKCLDDSDDESYKKLPKDKLIELVDKLKLENKKVREAAFPYKERSELISNWSKRVENTVLLYEKEMSTQKAHLEKSFLEKLEMAKELILIEEENKMREELEKLEDKHKAEMESFKTSLENQYKNISQNKSVLTDKHVVSLEKELEEAKRKINETESTWKKQIAQAHESNDQLKQQIAHLKSEMKQITHKYEQAIREQKELEIKISKEIADYAQKLNEKSEILAKLENDFSELEEVKQSLEEESETQESEIKNLKSLIASQNKKLENFDSELRKYTISEANHKIELNKKTSEINQLKNDLSEVKGELDESNATIKKLHLELKNLESINASKQVFIDSNLNKENKNNNTSEAVPQAKRGAKTKLPSKSTKTSKSSIISNNEIVVEDDSDEAFEEKKLKLNDMTNSKSQAASCSIIEDSVNEIKAPLPARKKSTLNRLTEFVSKSPILESIRSRPSRKTKASTISTAQDHEIINTAIANDNKKRATKVTSKKTSLLESFNNLGKQSEELENINEFEEQMELETAAAKTKKKRGKK